MEELENYYEDENKEDPNVCLIYKSNSAKAKEFKDVLDSIGVNYIIINSMHCDYDDMIKEYGINKSPSILVITDSDGHIQYLDELTTVKEYFKVSDNIPN